MTIEEKKRWRKKRGIYLGQAFLKRQQKKAKILRQIENVKLQADARIRKLTLKLERVGGMG